MKRTFIARADDFGSAQAANAAWVKEGLCPSAAPPPKGWQGQIKVSLDNPGHMAAIPPPLVPIQCHWLLPGIG